MNAHGTAIGILAAVTLAAAIPAAAQEDHIVFRDGRPNMPGRVVEIRYDRVRFEIGGAIQEEDAWKIKNIEFAPENVPFEFYPAMQELQTHPSKDLAARFERIKRDSHASDPVKQYCLKYIMDVHVQLGDADGAIAAAEALRSEKPDSFFLRDSFLVQYEAARMKRDVKLMEETLKKFSDVQRVRRVSEWAKDLDLMRADLFEATQRSEDALKIYDKYRNERDAAFREIATLGYLRCLSATKLWDDLRSASERILADLKGKPDTAVRLQLAATVGKGDALLAEGKAKEALLSFIWGAWELGPRLGERAREHEEALAKASIACTRVAATFGEVDRKSRDLYVDRARGLLEELKRTYEGTGWAPQVEAAIREAAKGQ